MSTISSEPNEMARKKSPQILAEIQQLAQAGEVRKLRHYLIQLAKWGEKPAQYESVFQEYLYSLEADLKEAAVCCLLVTLRLQKDEYRRAALALVQDEAQDFDVRMWAGSGLALAYRGTKNPELLASLLAVVDDEGSDKYLKISFIQGIVLLLGTANRAQWLRAQEASLPTLQVAFAQELAQARKIARGR